MKGCLFDILFSALRQQPRLPTVPQSPEPTFHAEHFVLARFQQASIAAYQARDETNNTFNIYLIIAGIIAAGLPVIQGLIIQSDVPHDLKLLLSFMVVIILLFAGLLSFLFLSRFLMLAQERFENIKTMNNIRDYYDKQLENTVNLDEIFGERQAKMQSISVLEFILYTVFVIGSLYIGGAFGTATNNVASILSSGILNSSFLNSSFTTSNIFSFSLFILVSVIMYNIYRRYYNSHISELNEVSHNQNQ